ncbi:hypothetical protein AX16_010988 [Volvariella volvacea WC 439]|nr:hypothetical protein AX16_010988 [Volvariella volvacea WC 439]
MTFFTEFEVEFGDRMKQEKARKWIVLWYKDLNPLIATFRSGMNAWLAEDVICNGGLWTMVFDDFVILVVECEMTLEAQDHLFPRKPAYQPPTPSQPFASTSTTTPPHHYHPLLDNQLEGPT